MSSTWLKNMAGIKQTDYELLQIPRPKLELEIHVTTKTIQAGAFIGSIIAGPLVHFMKRGSKGTTDQLKQEIINGGLYGSLAGLVAGSVGNVLYMQKYNQLQIYDRCYRLRFNVNQLTTDRLFYLGSVLGAGAGGPGGYVVGANLALFGSFVLNSIRK